MHIMVLGSGGQLGSELLRTVTAAEARATGLSHRELDITRRADLEAAVFEHRPDVVINAAAYTAVARAEREPELAFVVNSDGARNAAAACDRFGVTMIHLSTDYVFDGTKSGAYRETDPVNPQSVYGKSKKAGERAVRETLERHFIVRTSWLLGASGHNFVRTILKLARQQDVLRVVADQRGCPTATRDLATALYALARCDARASPDAFGTYHYAGAPATTWYELAEVVCAELSTLGISRPKVEAISSSELPQAVPRPKNSELDGQKIQRLLGIAPSNWRSALSDVVARLVKREM